MSLFEVGNTVTWGLTVEDSDGVAANVGTGPTAVVLLPDGLTTASATVANPTTGSYVASYVSTTVGQLKVTWEASGLNSGGFPYTDYATVFAPRFIISLAEAREALNLPAAATDDDPEIRGYVAATTAVIEGLTGPLLPATKIETHDGDGSTALPLWNYPTAITSVVEDGTTLSSSAYAVGLGGILWRRTGYWSSAYAGNIVVTYTVGDASTVIPENVALAAKEQLRHLYQVGQVATRPALGGGEPSAVGYTPMGFAVPNRVIELLGDDLASRAPKGMP